MIGEVLDDSGPILKRKLADITEVFWNYLQINQHGKIIFIILIIIIINEKVLLWFLPGNCHWRSNCHCLWPWKGIFILSFITIMVVIIAVSIKINSSSSSSSPSSSSWPGETEPELHLKRHKTTGRQGLAAQRRTCKVIIMMTMWKSRSLDALYWGLGLY